jgi:hypothetical protein
VRWWLIRDAVRRQLYAISIAVLLLAAFWTQVGRGRMVAIAVIGSMIATYLLGLGTTTTTVTLREVRLRPVSQRAVWQATWILSVIVVPLMVALGKLVGGFAIWMGNGDVVAFGSLASLSSLYDVLFGGVMLGALGRVGWIPLPQSPGLKRIVIEVLPLAFLLLLFPGGFLLPVFAYPYLPHAWTAITWNSAMFLIAAAGVGIAAWFGTAPAAQPGFARLHQVHGSRVATLGRPGTASGWRVVAWLEVRFLLTILTLMAIAAIVAGPTLRMFGRTAPLAEMAGAMVRYFFSPVPNQGFSMFVLAAAIIGVMTTSNLLQPMLRQLRTLPVSRFRLTAILLILPVGHVVLIWIILELLHVLSEHAWPPVLRLDIFALAAGFAMFSQSFQMRFPVRGLQHSTALMAPAMMIGWSALGGGESNVQVAIFAAGVTTLCVAIGAILTLQSLSRAATYRAGAALSPRGVSAPTQG